LAAALSGGFAQAQPAPARPATEPPKAVEGLTVRGQSQSLRTDIDRRSYDLGKDLQAQTGSIADALRNVPSVDVDVQGNVSLRGDPNVTIMIDGKPSSLFSGPARAQILQQLPANGFERVEVLTNPSAAFSPNGAAGIINLISKKTRQPGRGGSARIVTGGADRSQGGVNLSSVGRKLTLSGDLMGVREVQSVTNDDRRSTFDPLSGRLLDSDQLLARRQTVELLNGRAAFDYDLSARTRISGELRGNALSVDADDETHFAGLAPGGLGSRGFVTNADDRFQQDTLTANASLRRKFGTDPDHELVLDATQERTTNSRRRRRDTSAFGPGLADRVDDIRSDTSGDQTRLKADFTRPFASGVRLKAGYELQYDRNDFDNFGLTGVDAAQLAPDPGLIDRFRFRRTINSGYVTWQQPVGSGWTLLGGLRAENTRIDLRDAVTGFSGSNDDTRLYPSLHLTWKRSAAEQITASYSERIQRPQPSDYNPFPLFVNPLTFQAGNPNLQPQETHSFELGWQHRKGLAYYLATLYWRQNDKGVTDVVRDVGGGVLVSTKANLAESRNGGVELVANGRLWSRLNYNLSGNAYWTELEAAQLGFPNQRSGWTLAGRGSITWQITAKDQLQLSGNLTGKRLTPQGYREPLGLLFVGYRRKLNADWSVYVTGRDLLNSYKDVLVIDTPQLNQRVETRVKLRAVLVGVTYTFGSGQGRRAPGMDLGGGVGAGIPR